MFVSALTGRRGWHRACCGAAASGERRDVVAGWRAWRAVGVRAGHGSPDSVQPRPQMHPRGAREMLLALPSHRGRRATAMQSNRTAERGNGGVGHRGEGYRRCLIRRGDVPTSVMHGLRTRRPQARSGRVLRARVAAHRAARTRVPKNEIRAQDASASRVGHVRSSCPLPHAARVCGAKHCARGARSLAGQGRGSTSAGASVAAGPARVAVGSLASLAPLLPRVAEAYLPGRRDRGCGAQRGEKTSAASVSGWWSCSAAGRVPGGNSCICASGRTGRRRSSGSCSVRMLHAEALVTPEASASRRNRTQHRRPCCP